MEFCFVCFILLLQSFKSPLPFSTSFPYTTRKRKIAKSFYKTLYFDINQNIESYSAINFAKLYLDEKGVKNYPWHHLLGVSQETRFDANCLSLDENTVITSGYDKDLSDKLKKYNIEMIPWVNRWNFLWSGGAHCCSVDLAREGKLIDYFS